jgi:hypothetical protein
MTLPVVVPVLTYPGRPRAVHVLDRGYSIETYWHLTGRDGDVNLAIGTKFRTRPRDNPA